MVTCGAHHGEEAPSTCCTHDLLHGLRDFLHVHQNTFATSSTDLGYCGILQHDIDTGDAPPIKQSPRRPPLAARDAEDQILDEMLESGVIEPSDSPWASPVCWINPLCQNVPSAWVFVSGMLAEARVSPSFLKTP